MPEISIIILTLNSIQFIKSCLDSVWVQNYQNIEVIIVDNGSKDGTVDFIRKNYPQVIVIENNKNLGACKARNQGIESAKGEWIITLDCDTTLEKDFFAKILKAINDSSLQIAIIQPKILKSNKKTIHSCGIYLSKLRRFYDMGKGKPDNGKFNRERYIFGASSAASLYNRKMLEEIKEETGYFDERFFFLVEDVDLALRAQAKGWKTLFYPQAVCYHTGNSSDTSKKLRQYFCWRNRELLLGKCRLSRFKRGIISLCYDFPRLFFLFLVNSYVRNEVLKKNRFAQLQG
jgi:GT2 family glycosyltransferase